MVTTVGFIVSCIIFGFVSILWMLMRELLDPSGESDVKNPNPAFRYGDYVEVVSGFHKGVKGQVVNANRRGTSFYVCLEILRSESGLPWHWFKAAALKPAEGTFNRWRHGI